MFRFQVIGAPDDGYTSVEVCHGDALVAVVYELPSGWKVDLYQSPGGMDFGEFVKALHAAQTRLLEYVNRRGENPPEGLTRAGFSLWLMEKADGTAMGIKLDELSD
jgi:hypothetical protein